MANTKIRKKTGMFEYRRVVPARLRTHLPHVPGFSGKPCRTEFTKSLGTREIKKANAAAVELDALVDAAFAEAERRLAGAEQSSSQPEPSSAPTAAPLMIDPEEAFKAIERWATRHIREARLRIFNAELPVLDLGDDAHARSELAYSLSQPRSWEKIKDFDTKLVAALKSEGIKVSTAHPAIGKLRLAFKSEWQRVIAAEKKFREGEWGDVEEPSGQVAASLVSQAKGLSAITDVNSKSLEQALEDYLGDNPTRRKGSERDSRMIVKRLVEFVGTGRAIASIEIDDIRHFRELIRAMPSRPSHAQRGLSITQLAEIGKELAPERRMKQRTVNKWFDLLSALFEHAFKNRLVGFNPVRGLKIPKTRHMHEEKRVPLSKDELVVLFKSTIFTGCASLTMRHRQGPLIIKDAKYWVAIICLYSGARINEIGQAHLEDVCSTSGHDGRVIHYLSITTISEDTRAAEKTVKNISSIRKVPIHHRILELGFLAYVEDLRRAGKIYLFPDLNHGGAYSPTKNLSHWYGRYMDRIGLHNPRVTFHSLRHNFKDAARNCGIGKEISDRLTGHKDGSVSESYGVGPELDVLDTAIQKITYPALLT